MHHANLTYQKAAGFIFACMLAAVGLIEILLSIPVSILAWAIMGNEIFSAMQGMVIFIVCGVGADNVFVYVDAFRQASVFFPDADQATRFVYAYRRATKAVTVTHV